MTILEEKIGKLWGDSDFQAHAQYVLPKLRGVLVELLLDLNLDAETRGEPGVTTLARVIRVVERSDRQTLPRPPQVRGPKGLPSQQRANH